MVINDDKKLNVKQNKYLANLYVRFFWFGFYAAWAFTISLLIGLAWVYGIFGG